MKRARQGFSLIEVLIAGAMFSMGTAGILSAWVTLQGLIDTQRRGADAVVVAEDVLDALRLQPRGGRLLLPGNHERYFTRDRVETEVATSDGFVVAWSVGVVDPDVTYRRVDLAVRWLGIDRREHRFTFVTFRPG
jgi:prepilin-type N-terminal cleavage/methylation domain-containing protein